MHFVYIIESQIDKSHYIGYTANLKRRLKAHNQGEQKYTKGKRPYTLKWYCLFPNKKQALAFEKYLKSASGIAFSRKRLL